MFSSIMQTNRGYNQGTKKACSSSKLFTDLRSRANKLDITNNRLDDDDDDDIIIAIDNTGIKVTNRGQWMQEK
jgi:hypothetical protein